MKSTFASILAWITCLLTLFTVLFWATNLSFAGAVDEFLQELAGASLSYVLLMTLFSAACGLWALLRILAKARGQRWLALLRGRIAFITLAIIHAVLTIAIFVVLFLKDPLQAVRLGQWIMYFGSLLVLPVLMAVVLLTLPIVARAFHQHREQAPHGFIFVALWVFLWSAALWSPPTSVYRGELPAKPMLIAHRGASSLAPENTLAAFRLAAQIGQKGVVQADSGLQFGDERNDPGVVGVETDIRISLDGTLFLMHDATLSRTTDVADVYPERNRENASQFTMVELKNLNAGAWFLGLHPASSLPAGLVSAADADAYLYETIPTLEEWLQLVKQDKLTVIFDLLPPPAGHPYADQFHSLAIEQILQADIADQVWFLAGNEQAAITRSDIVNFRLANSTDYTHPPSVSELRSLGFEIVNSEYGLSAAWIAKYVRAGIHVNVWTVDEAWQFSRLWLLGVNSVTTNNLAGFAAMPRPYLAIPYGWFALAWCTAGLLLGGYAALRIWKWKQK